MSDKGISFWFVTWLLWLVFPSVTAASAERITIGELRSRALWTPALSKAPAIILIPGSGFNGPEEMVPGKVTEDRKPHSLFEPISRPFIAHHWNVLCLGKPGVEFFTDWSKTGAVDPKTWFYDETLSKGTTWTQLVDNLAAGIAFLKKQKTVDSGRIFILGHSEGTQVATDYAKRDPSIAGYILLGYSAYNIKEILEWQMIRRPLEHFISTDVDRNHKGYVTRADAAKWPSPILLDDEEFIWPWKKGQDRLSYAEIEQYLRTSTGINILLEKGKTSTHYNGVFERPPLFQETARIGAPLFVFTGSLDLQTPPAEAIKLEETCKLLGKKNCRVTLLPGLGHGFSPPRGPRKHPLADLTVGPIYPELVAEMEKLATSLGQN